VPLLSAPAIGLLLAHTSPPTVMAGKHLSKFASEPRPQASYRVRSGLSVRRFSPVLTTVARPGMRSPGRCTWAWSDDDRRGFAQSTLGGVCPCGSGPAFISVTSTSAHWADARAGTGIGWLFAHGARRHAPCLRASGFPSINVERSRRRPIVMPTCKKWRNSNSYVFKHKPKAKNKAL